MAVHVRHIQNVRAPRLTASLRQLEEHTVRVLHRVSVPALRIAIGVVFIWFGALKVEGTTPVGDLVAATVPFLDRHWFVPTLGLLEVALGLALVSGRALRLVTPVMVAHLAGTFLVLVTQPAVAFQHGNPLLLTTVGEFVVKNVVFIAAGLVILSRSHRPEPAAG
jgi:putative oxidoreductase